MILPAPVAAKRVLEVDAGTGGLDHHLARIQLVERHLDQPGLDLTLFVEDAECLELRHGLMVSRFAPHARCGCAQVLRGLHLDQAAAGALDAPVSDGRPAYSSSSGASAARISFTSPVVELVHQPCEAAHAFGHRRARTAAPPKSDGMVPPSELDVIGGPARPVAQLARMRTRPCRAQAAVPGSCVLRFPESHRRRLPRRPPLRRPALQPLRARSSRGQWIHSCLLQGTQPVVAAAVELDALPVLLLEELDGGQELRALQTVLIELIGLLVGGGHERRRLDSNIPSSSPRMQHRVADIGDVELVQAQQAALLGLPLRDDAQRLRPAPADLRAGDDGCSA